MPSGPGRLYLPTEAFLDLVRYQILSLNATNDSEKEKVHRSWFHRETSERCFSSLAPPRHYSRSELHHSDLSTYSKAELQLYSILTAIRNVPNTFFLNLAGGDATIRQLIPHLQSIVYVTPSNKCVERLLHLGITQFSNTFVVTSQPTIYLMTILIS